MRILVLAAIVLCLCGCGGGSGSGIAISPFQGTWNGTWTNVNDATDTGTSVWTINALGAVDGHDYDPGRMTTFHVVGSVTPSGALTSMSTPVGGSPATLNGPFTFTDRNHFSGTLAWGVQPPLSYLYTFIRQ